MISYYQGLRGVWLILAALSETEVQQVSTGSALSRTAIWAFHSAACKMIEHGTMDY
jgi:hypothetical protein